MTTGTEGLFARIEEFPNSDAQARLAALVGLDETVDRLVSEAVVLLDPDLATAWSLKVHGKVIPAVLALRDRTPMFIFAGAPSGSWLVHRPNARILGGIVGRIRTCSA